MFNLKLILSIQTKTEKNVVSFMLLEILLAYSYSVVWTREFQKLKKYEISKTNFTR